MDFTNRDGVLAGEIPPHAGKTCPMTGAVVEWKDSKILKEEYQAAARAVVLRHDQERKDREEQRRLDRLVDEDREKNGLPPLRHSTYNRSSLALLALFAAIGGSQRHR